MITNDDTEFNNSEQPKHKKLRKPSDGPLRNKTRTMARMVAAVGKVIQKKGYPGLTAPNIALAAGVDKKLVYTYFGGVDNLIEEYIHQKDFWKPAEKKRIEDLIKKSENINKKEVCEILQSQFITLQSDKALQKIIHWELGETNKILRNIANRREEIVEQLFSIIMPDFEKTNIDFRARFALILGGIYYLSLQKNKENLVCGINIKGDSGKERIENAIKDFIFEAYEKTRI